MPSLAEVTSPLFASRWKSLVLEEWAYDRSVADALVPAVDAYCIVVVTGGSALLEAWDGRQWAGAEVRPGTVALTSPGRATRYRWSVRGPEPLTTAHLLLSHDTLRTAAVELGLGRRPVPLRDAPQLADAPIAATTNALLVAGRSGAAEAYARSAAGFLAMHLLTRYTSRTGDETTARVLGVFRDAVGRPTSRRKLAVRAGVGEARLARIVREATGQSPWDYLVGLRIAEAERLLTTTALPVTEIGYRCGFATPSHFAAAFRRATGSTPTARREEGVA